MTRPARTTRLAVLAVVLASAFGGALTGAGSAAAGPGETTAAQGKHTAAQDVEATCPFPAPLGPRTFSLHTTATMPAVTSTGAPVAIDDLTMKFTLPRDAAQALFGTAKTIDGRLVLELAIQRGDKRDLLPVLLAIPATPLPETGDVTFTATGAPPPIAVDTPGAVTVSLTAPTVTLGPAAAPGTEPPGPVTCALTPEQNTTLGAIAVQSVTPVRPAPQDPAPAPGTPGAPGEVAVQTTADPPPTISTPLVLIRVVSTATVTRLGAKAVSTPSALLNGTLQLWVLGPGKTRQKVVGSISFKPVTVTYLSFGFTPTSATVEFLPVVDYRNSKFIDVDGELLATPGKPSVLTSDISVIARMSDARVNGVPLDLGPDCVTADPVKIHVEGIYDPFKWGFLKTGPEGFRLPGFRNCGVAEPLSQLLTGMASGPGNSATIETLNMPGCYVPDHTKCPPPPQKPPGQ
ncbi:DUF6801 domain-containing protein [Amycolatopsis samaneae]|uniref:DUF6801 domain-containing protein n=1 Tax=Amycolatopsis samaneae TaxID=664691 RepID=A0ABW5G9Q8_9PSEU